MPLGVTIYDAEGAAVNAASVTLTITRPDGTAEAGTTPTNPATGRYEFDFVPTVVGVHQVLWQSTDPATVFGPDAVDVRPATPAAVSLDDLRDYLNKALTGSAANADEDELRAVLAAAVERVGRHLGREVLLDGQISQAEILAIKLVAAEFWRPQRAPRGGIGASAGLPVSEMDSGPAGTAPLEVRLAELLGPAVSGRGAVLAPVGCFPSPSVWPDAPYIPRVVRNWP